MTQTTQWWWNAQSNILLNMAFMKNEPAHFCYIINSTLNHLSLIWFKNAVLGLYVPLPSQSSLNLRSKNAQGSQKKKANCSCPYCLGTSKFGSSPFAVSFQNISKQLYKRAEKTFWAVLKSKRVPDVVTQRSVFLWWKPFLPQVAKNVTLRNYLLGTLFPQWKLGTCEGC